MKKLFVLVMIIGLFLPQYNLLAKTIKTPKQHQLEFAGWIPYWRKTAGTADVAAHIEQLNSISPFEYNVDKTGNILNTAKLDQAPWTDLFVLAKQKKVTIIPAILWGDKQNMYDVLSNPKLRKEHTKQITEKILDNPDFDGVDIDYEGKSPETKKYFTLFLRNLAKETRKRKKTLICTIEPRTPIEDKVSVVDEAILASIQYSNDYHAIAEVCDRVRVMTYDQGAIDIKLNAEKKSNDYYAPVADSVWVEKVIKETLTGGIPKNKLELGVATYGYVYELTPRSIGGYTYKRMRAINYPKAVELGATVNRTFARNSAGEVSYSYLSAVPQGGIDQGKTTLVWVSDSQAISDKVKLARKYKLRGISVFKFDGENDGKLWDVLKNK